MGEMNERTTMPPISGSEGPGASAPATALDGTPTLHVVLDRPRIAGNVGAIARLCAATASRLHICGPLGFHDGGAALKRPGVDTWGKLALHFHLSTSRCLDLLAPLPIVVVEVGDGVPPDQAPLPAGTVVVLGPEDGSVAEHVAARAGARITLPMAEDVRSLNVAQCAAVIAFEALRQQRG
jgi:tRNA (cytidine/uridine-2'-O-)-methyltransferase